MERTKLLQQIYARLARLEESREQARLSGGETDIIDDEMHHLRTKLQEVMNSVCPVIKGGK